MIYCCEASALDICMGECVGNAWVGTVLGMVHSLAVNSEAFSAPVTFQKRKANRRRSRWNTKSRNASKHGAQKCSCISTGRR